jgi:hypothetical protein
MALYLSLSFHMELAIMLPLSYLAIDIVSEASASILDLMESIFWTAEKSDVS